MLELSKRLSLIASFVDEGSSVCDVGTDHGYLPAFLYLSNKAKCVVATDINEKPLQSARKNLNKLGVDGVKLVLCDGLAGVEHEKIDTVIIAGMGGEVISGIIERAAFLRNDAITLILQPTTAAKELRRFLARNGFAVEREEALQENGKIYSVMVARYTDTPYSLTETRLLIGILKPDCDNSRAYILKQYRIAQKCADQLNESASKQEEYIHYQKIADDLMKILGGQDGI